jgi:septal ring factor EnvC (AmiA/AmiB activator)
LLEFESVADRPGARLSWTLVAASVLFALLLLYVMFVDYLPAKQRVTDLERELKGLYEHEAELQTKLHQQEEQNALRERQLAALSAERDALVKRLEELERELAGARRKR